MGDQEQDPQTDGEKCTEESAAIARAQPFGDDAVNEVKRALQQGTPNSEIIAFLEELEKAKDAPHGEVPSNDASGTPVKTGDMQDVQLAPSVHLLPDWQSSIASAALIFTPTGLGPLTAAAILITSKESVTIGFGTGGGGGLLLGSALEMGVLVCNGKLGVYGSMSLQGGGLASLGAQFSVTVVKGGVNNFTGFAKGYGFTLGSWGGVVLFQKNGDFLGFSGNVGLSMGSPISVYKSVQATFAP